MPGELDYIRDVGRAFLIKKALQNMLDAEPKLDFYSDHIKVYFPPDQLIIAQKNFEKMMETPDKKIRTDLMPVLNPFIIKKVGFWVIVTALSLFLFGTITGEK